MEKQKLTYTVAEMAKVVGISRSIAYTLVEQEGFPAIRVSEKRIVIPVEALNKWLSDPANFTGAVKSRG